MRTHVTLVLTDFDHPKVEKETDDDGDEYVTLRLCPEVTLMGSPDEVKNWADELAMRLSIL